MHEGKSLVIRVIHQMRVALASVAPAGVYCRVRLFRGRARGIRTRASPNPPFDAYEVLGVDDDAKETEIKEAWKMLQRRYHPDSGSEADAKKSADINRAYDILTDKSARVRLDDALMRSNDGKRRRAARTVVSASGLVGPLRERLLASMEVCGSVDACEIDVTERMVESIREWGRMLAFTSELPLPLPLQVDDVPSGVKVAIVKFDGKLIEVGALNLTVEEDVDAGKVDVVITRSWSEAQRGVDADTQLPGEQRILTDFSQEFNFLVGVESGRLGSKPAGGSKNPLAEGLSNVVSSISSFALPVMPLFGSARNVVPGGSYDAYKIRSGSFDSKDEDADDVVDV